MATVQSHIRRTLQLPSILLLALVLALGGCGEDASEAPPQEPVVTDSAGVTQAVFPDGLPREGARLTEPEILIGEDEEAPGHQLHFTAGPIELSDGRLVLVDPGSGEVRLFDADGVLQIRAGGLGQGPGEFQAAGQPSRAAGDSIGVADLRQSVLLFGPDGSFGRRIRPSPQADAPTPQIEGLLANRRLVTVMRARADEGQGPDGLIRDTVRVALFDSEGAPLTVLGEFPGRERLAEQAMIEGALVRAPIPFQRPVRVSAAGSAVVVGLTDRFEVRYFDADGTLEGTIRVEGHTTPVTDEVMETFLDHQTGLMQFESGTGESRPLTESEARAYREHAESLPRVPSLPHFDRLLLGASGGVWIRDYVPPYEEAEWIPWWEFSPRGELLRTVELPADFHLRLAADDYLLGILPDELDVQRVVRYELPERGNR